MEGPNPYTPNAGARPAALVGRDRELEEFERLLSRLLQGYTAQSMLITGLRGVGKTVLLGEFRRRALANDWVTVATEIRRKQNFGERIVRLVRRALLDLAPQERWKDRAQRAAGVLKSFQCVYSTEGTVTFGFDVTSVPGRGDSGDLGEDLTDLFLALGEAAQEYNRGVIFLFDEVQFLPKTDLEALIAALHMTVQRELPITFVGAGLPQLPRLVGAAKSYAERLFTFKALGRLDENQATRGLTEPAAQLNVQYTAEASNAIVQYTEGYPYFIQEYGNVVWDYAPESTITLKDVENAQTQVETKLDESFFRVRVERASEQEIEYLRAMAQLGDNPQQAKLIADILKTQPNQLAPIRARLIEKGLLYTTSQRLTAFTVPQFDRFMRRAYNLKA